MSIDVHKIKKGDRVIYANPEGGYPHDVELGKKHLELNRMYTVDEITIHDWHTEITLMEKYGLDLNFNSCLFEGTK